MFILLECEVGKYLPAQLYHTGICSFGGCSETGAQIGTVLVVQGKNSNHVYHTGYRLVSDLFLNVPGYSLPVGDTKSELS